MKMFSRPSLFALLVFFVSLSTDAFPQAGVASLTGLVTDPSGAIVAGAQVTANDVATQVSRSTVTDKSGYYAFVGLTVGLYDISVNQPGFQSQRLTAVLDPSGKSRQDFHLAVAGVTSEVQVIAAGPEVSRDDATIGTVIDNETIVDTPLFMRNWDDLIRLVPGVQAQRFTQQSGASTSGTTGLFNVRGLSNEQNNFILDGIDNNTFSENIQELSASAARPSVDVIGEFKLINNAYTAAYGRSPGAIVDVTTVGGTERYHGLLYEYIRNRVFDSNDYFSINAHLPQPKEIQNQFGGSFGGPIVKKKLFGFFNYEGTRIDQGITRISTVPLANERAGNFSAAAAAANGVTYKTIKNPATGVAFPNNTIPGNLIDPYGQKIMNTFPAANQPGDVNNYAFTGSLTDNDDEYDARGDWTPSASNLVFARYTGSNRIRDVPGYFGGTADGSSTSSWGNSTLKSWSAALGWTHIFGAALTNDLRFGFVRNFAYDQQQPYGTNKNSAYIPGVPDNPATEGGIGLTTYTGITFIGSPGYLPKQQIPQQFQSTDTLGWTKGTHFFKFGADVRAPMRNIFRDQSGMNGNLTFSGTFSGNSYADGLLGYVYQGSLSNVHNVDLRLWMASGFVQDDWKITRKLTMNLGLRYDFATPPYSANNELANFDTAGSGSLVDASSGSLSDQTQVQINTLNFAPRVGFSYSLGNKTVVRGGYGLYNMLFHRVGSEDQLIINYPWAISATLNSSGNTPAFMLQNGFPAATLVPAPAGSPQSATQLAQQHIHAMQPDSPVPYTQNWSFGFQRELPLQLVLTVDYVGSKSTHLDVINDLNQYGPNTTYGQTNKVFPYPNFGYIEYSHANGVGNYNDLEASAQRRFTKGLSLEAAYTWSKATATSYAQTFTRSLTGTDVPQRFVLSYLYELPFGHDKPLLASGFGSIIMGGWRTSGIYTYSYGLPITVSDGGNYASQMDAYGVAKALPNVIGTPLKLKNANCWFYYSGNKNCKTLAPNATDAYALPATGASLYGNGGLATLRGPDTNVFDFALMRDFDIREKMKVQFRWEVFNLTNNVLFAQPSATLTSSSVGTITSLAGDPRIMQFALRLSF